MKCCLSGALPMSLSCMSYLLGPGQVQRMHISVGERPTAGMARPRMMGIRMPPNSTGPFGPRIHSGTQTGVRMPAESGTQTAGEQHG